MMVQKDYEVESLPSSRILLNSSMTEVVLYDAPSLKANPLFIFEPGTPVEVIVKLNAWDKVLDAPGKMAWIKKNAAAETTGEIIVPRAGNILRVIE